MLMCIRPCGKKWTKRWRCKMGRQSNHPEAQVKSSLSWTQVPIHTDTPKAQVKSSLSWTQVPIHTDTPKAQVESSLSWTQVPIHTDTPKAQVKSSLSQTQVHIHTGTPKAQVKSSLSQSQVNIHNDTTQCTWKHKRHWWVSKSVHIRHDSCPSMQSNKKTNAQKNLIRLMDPLGNHNKIPIERGSSKNKLLLQKKRS